MPATPPPLDTDRTTRLIEILRSMDRTQQYTDEHGGAEIAWYYVREDVETVLGVPRGTLNDPPEDDWNPDQPGERGPWRPDWVVPPGETLQEWMDENGVGQDGLADATGIDPHGLAHVLRGSGPISEDMAGRLERHTGISAQMWMSLQRHYEEGLEWKRRRNR